MVQVKRKFGSTSSNPQPEKNPKRVKLHGFKIGESNPKRVAREGFVINAFAATPDLIEAYRGNVMVTVNLGI